MRSSNRFVSGAVLLLCLSGAPAWGGIDGTALATANGRIVRVPVVNGVAGPIDSVYTAAQWGSSRQDYAGLEGPCFSPDGKRIAFTKKDWRGPCESLTLKVFIVNSDGTGLDTICFGEHPDARDVFMSWDDGNRLWWSEQTEKVFRVDLLTRKREVVAVLDDFSGDWPPNPRRIDALKVSRDGTRAGFMLCGVGYCKTLDFTTFVLRDYGYGCQATVSPDGNLVTHSSLMSGYSGHQVGYIHELESKAIVDTFFAPGAVPNDSGALPRMITIRFSHSSNRHIVFRGEDALDGLGFVHDLIDNETVELGECGPADFWAGALPEHTGPFLSLDPSLLVFNTTNGLLDTQTVASSTTAGAVAGQLTTSIVPATATWLTATPVAGAVRTTVDTTGLAAGSYSATVAVTADSASNVAVYTVVLNHRMSVAAPTGLYLGRRQCPFSCIGLGWQDHADNEDGFIIERMIDGGPWETADTVPAGTTACMDTVHAVGTFAYRVRAYAGSELSGYTNEASLRTTAVQSISVIAPAQGDTLLSGDTARIRWITDGITTVEIKYSVDDGEHWLNVTSGAAVGIDSAAWGDYPWVVPGLDNDSVRIMVHAYAEQTVAGLSGYFAVRTPSRDRAGMPSGPPRTVLHTPAVSVSRGVACFRYELADTRKTFLAVYRLNGARVVRLPLRAAAGRYEVVWRCEGRGDGFYLARLEHE